jgi:hypothetical protein
LGSHPSRLDTEEGVINRNFSRGTIEIADEASKTSKHKIEISKVRVNFTTSRADEIFISCFSVDPNVNFGNARVEVFNPALFLASLKGFLKKADIELFFGQVEYYYQESVDVSHALKKIGFMKSATFKHEAEFRLAFLLNENHEFNSKILSIAIEKRYFTFSSKDFAKYMRLII